MSEATGERVPGREATVGRLPALIFLSYAHEDVKRVREIYGELKVRGLNLWFDKEDMRPGPWKAQLERAIAQSRYFFVCLSVAALRKLQERPGTQEEELAFACRIAAGVPVGELTIVPLRLEECGRGDHRLSIFHQYDLFGPERDAELDRLAVHHGGRALGDAEARDRRSADERRRDELRGEAAAYDLIGDELSFAAMLGELVREAPHEYRDDLDDLRRLLERRRPSHDPWVKVVNDTKGTVYDARIGALHPGQSTTVRLSLAWGAIVAGHLTMKFVHPPPTDSAAADMIAP